MSKFFEILADPKAIPSCELYDWRLDFVGSSILSVWGLWILWIGSRYWGWTLDLRQKALGLGLFVVGFVNVLICVVDLVRLLCA